ncbi:hypothetical protein DERF_005908 [Dermatophagoides farinae]|uniref:Uncharacterized protein n=1 Tax=Dermatophagoides farinae TaxID=6954 RepID=A0A922LBR0_DERFA|nr:hypothetical protein DERF_005908 [Dermatophagoides farinae]
MMNMNKMSNQSSKPSTMSNLILCTTNIFYLYQKMKILAINVVRET